MENVKLVKAATHAPRTGYNKAMWDAVAAMPGIEKGVSVEDLRAHLLAEVPEQQPSHALAHIKYLVRSKGALEVAA